MSDRAGDVPEIVSTLEHLRALQSRVPGREAIEADLSLHNLEPVERFAEIVHQLLATSEGNDK